MIGRKNLLNIFRTMRVMAPPLILIALTPSAAQAYIGPGAGLSAIGSLLAVVAVVVVAIVGFVWFPMKRLLRRRKPAPVEQAAAHGDGGQEP